MRGGLTAFVAAGAIAAGGAVCIAQPEPRYNPLLPSGVGSGTEWNGAGRSRDGAGRLGRGRGPAPQGAMPTQPTRCSAASKERTTAATRDTFIFVVPQSGAISQPAEGRPPRELARRARTIRAATTAAVTITKDR